MIRPAFTQVERLGNDGFLAGVRNTFTAGAGFSARRIRAIARSATRAARGQLARGQVWLLVCVSLVRRRRRRCRWWRVRWAARRTTRTPAAMRRARLAMG